ncbi:hypothetical protein LDENG_00098390 [Lucifuga dentata]|nr:hypothetical protein LDENG_00098390 [Lucifuga dentata]
MASGLAEEDDGDIALDIDSVHMLLHVYEPHSGTGHQNFLEVEHERIQKRTFTNWINVQLAKRCPPSLVSELFSDLQDGSLLLDLLEVVSGQRLKRERGRGIFQERANIETALTFLKEKSIKLVNINIPDIIDGCPSTILGLIWTIILHCHIEELASTLSSSSCRFSVSPASLDSWSGSAAIRASVPGSLVPPGQPSHPHNRFRISAKKTLLTWVRDQCQRVGCSVSVKDFKSSWSSGEAFLAILCSVRPQLVDLTLVQTRSNQENLKEAFHLAEKEFHIPCLLEPQDVDVDDPDEKSIMTYVAQFLQYSNNMAADHLQPVISGETVETKQEVAWTVVPQAAAPAEVEQSSQYEVLQRYKESSLAFQSQLLKNTLHLEEFISDIMDSPDNQTVLITQKLDQIIREPVDITSLTLADARILSDLQEMEDRLQSEMRKLSERGSEEEKAELEATSLSPLCQTLHNSIHHLNQLMQQLEKIQSAVQTLEHFLATLREVKAEIPVLLVKQQADQQQNESVWEQENHSWQIVTQRMQMAGEQSVGVDSLIKAAGMTLTMDGAKATCGGMVALLAQQLENMEKELSRSRKRERKESSILRKELKQVHEKMNPVEVCQSATRVESPFQYHLQEQQTPGGMKLEPGIEAKRSRLDAENEEFQTQTGDEQKAQRWRDEALKAKAKVRRSSQEEKEGEEREKMAQRRLALLEALREIQGEAERLGLQEPTLPAVQQRMRGFMEHKSCLAGLRSELQKLHDRASQSEGIPDLNQIREVEDLWEETKKAVSERLDQCCVLTELLKRFQSIQGELSYTLQRAEGAISLQASYIGKENLQRRLATVQEMKAELNGLRSGIEDVCIVCRQLRSHLHLIPVCTVIQFENEADALMDRWLDVSERTDSHFDNIHLGLTLWDRVLQLGAEVESWTVSKLDTFAQSSCFQNEEDIKALQNEIQAQEVSMEHFHRRAAEIQALFQSAEPPLELQVVESQLRKKIEQMKELFSEAEDVFRQMVAAKEQIAARMSQCDDTVQKIQDCLIAVSVSDVAAVLAKLKDLCSQLQIQEEQADSLLEDLHIMASIVSPEGLQSLAADGIRLQEKLRATRQLLSWVEEQTETDVQSLHSSQQISSLQKHKGAVESYIREVLEQVKENRNQKDQQVGEEATCVQTAVKQLAECLGNLCGNHEVFPDISQLKQQWNTIQDSFTWLTELAARISDLQKTEKSNTTQATLHTDAFITVDAVAKDLNSLRTALLQQKQECADNVANKVREVIRQLQKWNQTEQVVPPLPSQATLDEGLRLQRALHSMFSERDFLLNCLGAKLTNKLEKKALKEITKSTSKVETLSKCLLSQVEKQQISEDSTALTRQAAVNMIQAVMEPEKRLLGLPADLGTGERTGGSPEAHTHRSTMLEMFCDIQSLVEKSNIINRTQHLNWCLESSPGEPEIRLVRTVQKVLACRYQPAQLNITAMGKQLKEAEDYKLSVLELVDMMNSTSAATFCDPDVLKTMEGQWSAALLDASATVQIKAAQLDQVRHYHRQMKVIRAFLEVLAAEKEKMSSNTLGSSALQAEKLRVLLKTMELKRGMMEELLRLSRQLSVHLSDAESSGALLAQLGDIQEEWRILEGSIKRALRHTSNSTSQASLLIKEARQLQVKLEVLQKSNTFLEYSEKTHDSRSSLEFICLSTDLKLYNQLYLHLQSQSDGLGCFSGQKEKNEVKNVLQELRSLLSVTKSKIDTFTHSMDTSSAKINKKLRDLVIWVKQTELHISIRKKLALFPEDARIQIDEIKRIWTDVLSRQSKLQVEVDEIKAIASHMNKKEHDQVLNSLRIIEDLYGAIADSSAHALNTMEKNLQEREKLLHQLASIDSWLAEMHATRDPCGHVENVSIANIQKLESELRTHKLATVEMERHSALVATLADICEKTVVGLSPAESHYLVNRLSGLCAELDGLLAHEKGASWELEELIHERTISDEELSTIQTSLKQISKDLDQQRFPLTKDTAARIALLKHMLMEHQWQVQELQHCQEAKRSSLLCTIGELQDRCKNLSIYAFEQDKYLHLRNQMEESRDIAKGQIQQAKDKTITVSERFRLCQALLVELPLVKTQCQEAADQLEAIAQELNPAEFSSERQRIHHTVETLMSLEHSVTDDVKILEGELLQGLHVCSELSGLTEFFQRARLELEGAEPVTPDEKAIDTALQRYWVIWRNLESGMRVLEYLGQKEKGNLRNQRELYPVMDATMQMCHLQMESLSHARESLKDYHWAAQGAIGFLHNAEATFLSAPGGFLDCTEEHRQTQQALATLEDGFQTHISHLVELVPQQPCLSRPKTEQLHIGILSQLLVGRSIVEAQAYLRLESLQRCAKKEESHRNCHKEIRQLLSKFETRLSECAAEQVTSYDKSVDQQKRAQLLMEDLHTLAGKTEELTAGCPVQGCGVGKDGELGALWRRWVSLRRGISLLMTRSEQRREEWHDITISMEWCCSFLATLQAEASESQGEFQELLTQAEMYQAGLEQEQQALSSLEHQLEHALSLSCSQDPISPGPVGQRLAKVKEDIRSLKEKNLLVVAAAQREEKERRQFHEEIGEMNRHLFAILRSVEAFWDPSKQQELRQELSSHKTKLQRIMDDVQSSYVEIPDGISRQIEEVQLSLQRAEEKIVEKSDPVWKLSSRVVELGSGLVRVKTLLEQQSPTVSEAQKTLKHVWDELDAWHSHLMLLESEVQDLAEEHPDQAHLLMDHLTQPLQLYQNAAQMAERRTTFLGKIPACLQEFEDILCSASCWLDDSQSWLTVPFAYTTAKSLQSHANSLQLVLDDSERIRAALRGFRSVLDEISAVCDISTHEERLNQNDQQVYIMQQNIVGPLEQLLKTVPVVDAMEAELKTMEKNVTKIRMILCSIDNSSISLMEHLHNRQVILANVQSIQRTLEDMERCRGEIFLPQGAEESLVVFSRAKLLLQQLQELKQLTQQQAILLENKLRKEEECEESIMGVNITTVEAPNPPEATQLLDGSLQGNFVQQEAFEVCQSEEEEEEESPHSSSSGTLTCSIPEDPEETLQDQDFGDTNDSDEQSAEDIPEIKPLSEASESFVSQLHPKAEAPSVRAETEPVCFKTELVTKEFRSENVGTGLATMESRLESLADVSKSSGPEAVRAEPLTAAAISAIEDQHAAAATLNQHGSPKHKTVVTDTHANKHSHQTAAKVEDTRFIPVRPVTPFTQSSASVGEFIEEDEHLSSSTVPHQHLEKSEIRTSHGIWVEEFPQPWECSEKQIRIRKLTRDEEEDEEENEEEEEEQQRWSCLLSQISQKFNTLKKVQEEHQTMICSENVVTSEKVLEVEVETNGSAAAVLQQIHKSITLLRQLGCTIAAGENSADDSHPGVKRELHEALQRVLLCLDALTDLLLSPGGPGEDPQLRLLQHECVSAELVRLAGVLSNVESEARPMLLRQEADALHCLTCIQGCLRTVQLVLTSSQNQLLTHQHQELSSYQPCVLDEFEVGLSETFPSLKDAPNLECVLGRHMRKCPEENAKLQGASQALLQGIAGIMEWGEDCIASGQTNQGHNRSQIQAILCRRKKVLQVLGSQMAFLQYLFKHEPEAFKHQEAEWVELEISVKAFQQQAAEQEVDTQRRLQEWSRWENNCGKLGRLLDELEAFISSGESDGEDNEEAIIQHQLEACQHMLDQLDQSKATLGLVFDQEKVLQTWPVFATSVCQVRGALELRWRSVYRRTEQETQRCRDIQDSRARFHTGSALVSEWLDGANKRLKAWSDLADTSDLNQEGIQSHLIKLLDFSMEMEAKSVQKASVSRFATLLRHLREADCPGLRAQLAQLEMSWSQLASDLSRTQDRLQQRLLAGWPPLELLSELEDWLKKLQSRLSQEKEAIIKAKDAAQLMEVLQHYQEIKTGMVNAQLLLDFLCQSGPQVVGVDIQALHSQRTVFSERLGALRLHWLHLQGALDSQIHAAEQMRHSCAGREKRLQHLYRWIVEQKEKLKQWKQPTSQTLARKAVLEQEAVMERVKEVAVALQELKATRVHADKEEYVCDIAFAGQTESISHACADLIQQLDSLRPALQQAVEEWGRFERDLREVSLLTTKMHCALRHRAPLFSLKQVKEKMNLLQELEENTGGAEGLWAAVDKSYQSLVKTLHRGTAHSLADQVEEERQWWKESVQEVKKELLKTEETLSLWQEYMNLSDCCSLRLQDLWHQWEALSSSSFSPHQDVHAMVDSVEKLQDVAEVLQQCVGDVLMASKPLIKHLEPMAANIIKSEIRLQSHDILLLSQALSGKKTCLQEDLEQQKMFCSSLETLGNKMQTIQHKLKASMNDANSMKQILSEFSDLLPLLIDVREMSGYMSVNNQEMERLRDLSRQWVEGMTCMSDINREIQAESQHSQSFWQKCKSLTSIQENLEQESVTKNPQSYSGLQKMLTVHQKLQTEILIGQQLLQSLLCDAVESMEKETGEKQSELVAEVICVKNSWFRSVALVGQCRVLAKEQLSRWRVFHHGKKILWKLLRNIDPLLPPVGTVTYPLHHLQCVEETLDLHTAVYNQTLEAGRLLCKSTTESRCQSRLQTELQALEEAWEHSASLLWGRKALANTAFQKWSQCEDGIHNCVHQLDELMMRLKQLLLERLESTEEETFIQEKELSLERLANGLRELATMKTDLSRYVADGDSALLEQQLEQLHCQWEELCMKVSLRRQEIADRLNAWTIFNDKNKELCDWLTQMENKMCHCGDLSIEEMVEKLKKDCMEEINLFSENKSHLKQLGEQLLLASDEAKQTQVRGSLQEVNQRWHNLFHHIEARVKKLKETLVTVQQLDKNMSNLHSWLSRIEAELSRPITYSYCHHQEIQRRLAEQQELQRDIEQHTEGIASVLSLCDVLLRDEDAAGGSEAESDSLEETSHSLDQRWRTICAMALDRRLRIEETWRLWCKFLDDYSRFEDWLKMAERTAANPNSADVLYTVAKEELKKFEGFQRQVHERLTQLELVNNQYRRLARENRTDRASQLKAMVHEGNRRWDALHRRGVAILRRLKHFTSQREDFESTRESMLVWLTELDLQLTNVEHFSESDIHHKIQQLNGFQKEITLNTERIDGLIVFGESLIQKSSPQDAALIEDELEELHSYCQEVFSRLVRFHQRLSQPTMIMEEPELSGTSVSLEGSFELIGRPWLGRSQGSLPTTPTHLLTSPLERSGRETPVSVDSLPLEWDHTGDVGGSSSHEDDEEEEEHDEEGTYFSALSVPSMSMVIHDSPIWRTPGHPQGELLHTEAPPTLTSTPSKQGYLHLMSQCSGSIKDIKRVSLILDDEEQPQEVGLIGLSTSDKQSGVIERWELLQAQSRNEHQSGPQEPEQLASDLDDITSWLGHVIPELKCLHQSDPVVSVEDLTARAKHLKEMEKMFSHYKLLVLSVNLRGQEAPELQQSLVTVNRSWSRACTGLQEWDNSLRKTLMRCQEFHETLHSLLLWLAHAESRRYAVDISHPHTPIRSLRQHCKTLADLQEELWGRQAQQASLQALWSQLQPKEGAEESDEAQEKLHVTGSKLKLLLRQVDQDLNVLQQRLDCEAASSSFTEGDIHDQSADSSEERRFSQKIFSCTQRERGEPPPPRSFFYRVLRAAFPLHLLLLLLLLLPCLIPLPDSKPGCSVANNFARSFYPMLHYTNGPPPT